MGKTTTKRLEEVLTRRLHLRDPRFRLEKLSSGRISGSVISDSFKGVSDKDRQRRIWKALAAEFGEESTNVAGTLLAYTDAEWDVDFEDVTEHNKSRR